MYLNKLKRVYDGKGNVTLTGVCVVTGKEYSVTVKAKELARYEGGDYIQNAFPNTPAEEREFIISGTSPEGWKQIFGEEEEDWDGDDNDDGPVLPMHEN